jgi:hypothetical protein
MAFLSQSAYTSIRWHVREMRSLLVTKPPHFRQLPLDHFGLFTRHCRNSRTLRVEVDDSAVPVLQPFSLLADRNKSTLERVELPPRCFMRAAEALAWLVPQQSPSHGLGPRLRSLRGLREDSRPFGAQGGAASYNAIVRAVLRASPELEEFDLSRSLDSDSVALLRTLGESSLFVMRFSIVAPG